MDFVIAFNFPRTMALKREILRTVIQVTITTSGKYIAKILQAMLRVLPSKSCFTIFSSWSKL